MTCFEETGLRQRRRYLRALAVAAWIAWAGVGIGCGDPANGPTEDCAVAGDEDGNGLTDCDDPACADAAACQAVCGNNVREIGEDCDDGNRTDGDGCDNNCRSTGCGNGVATMGEECDDGNKTDGDGCDNNCTKTACGNGVATMGEACDDGNRVDTDGCRNDCKVALCGDGIAAVDATGTLHEDCDGAALGGAAPVETAACNLDCTPALCGDGKRNQAASEQCDDANMSDTDACTSGCRMAACGDGFIRAGVEQCDDGNPDTDFCDYGVPSCTVCNAMCQMGPGTPAFCGDFVTQAPFEACDDGNTVDADWCRNACAAPNVNPVYVKASNPNPGDNFGVLALSADGSTMAIGAMNEDSSATGINGNQSSNTATNSGAVYVFVRSGASWVQQAYIKASNTDLGDSFGVSVALSADGSLLAVGAPSEDSSATGANGNQADNNTPNSGAVYVFSRTGTTWSQQAYLKASNTGSGDAFGQRVAMAGDGLTLAVGALFERSAATGINGNQADNTAISAGAVYVFTRSGTAWSQQAYLKSSNTEAVDLFSSQLALSTDGSTLAVSSEGEDSSATGINGTQNNNTAMDSGAVYVFTRSGTTWTQQAYVKASNTETQDRFGGSGVSLSGDGATLAVGAAFEDGSSPGINGDQMDNSASASGAVYVYTRSGTMWTQQAYIKASNANRDHAFGQVALSANGTTLAVGASGEESAAKGIGGDQSNRLAPASGAVFVFTRMGTTWRQQSYVKQPSPEANDGFSTPALSNDGLTMVVAALGEDGGSAGVGGNQGDNSADQAGAVYVYR